jgi:hypothetical protein
MITGLLLRAWTGLGDGRVVRAAAAVCAVAFVVHFAWVAIAMALEPDALNYGEGITWAGSLRLLHGEPLYGNTPRLPHPYFAYPPLVPALMAAAQVVFGEGFGVARVVAIAGELVCAAFVALLVRRRGGRAGHVVVATALFLGAMSTQKFHGLVRVDTWTVALVLAAWLLTERAMQRDDALARGSVWPAAVAWALSGMAKPTALVTLLAVVAWGRAHRAEGLQARSLGLATASGALWLLACGLADVVTGGAFGWNVFVAQGLSGSDEDAFRFTFGNAVYGHQVVWAVGLAGVVLARRGDVLRWAWVVSAGWAALSLRKRGCDVNYMLELLALSCVAAGVFVQRLEELAPQLRRGVAGVLVLAAFVPVVVAGRGGHWEGLRAADARRDRAAVDAIVAGAEGPLLLEEPFYALRHRKPFAPGDTFHVLLLAEQGIVDPRPLLNAVATRQFSDIVVGGQIAARPELMAAIEANYEPVYRSRFPVVDSHVSVWRRRAPPASP